jgi:ABC-type nitrate/sulfonate/bicarbonate transport system substrate-binding protein
MKKLELGRVDFALCPTESIISYRTKAKPFDTLAIATIFQEDLSAITVLEESDIRSPKDLDNKTYSSYQARYEDGIVREMIKNDGGKGELDIIYPTKLQIWDTLLSGSSDATWIFLNWEGVAAEGKGQRLRYFKMSDYQIPYSYSPLITASTWNIKMKTEVYSAFLKATRKGFNDCHTQADESVRILAKYLPKSDALIDLNKALDVSLPCLGKGNDWGRINKDRIQTFLDWIREKELEPAQIKASEIATDICYPKD